MSTSPSEAQANVRKHFSSSILLWVRTDQPRQTGMDYWKGPHSKIISATPGLEEYRQIHLAEVNPGLWPATPGVETDIPVERKIDGVAEVTFRSPLSPLLGRKQTRLAYKDEINVFRRTLLYAGLPNSSRWYDVAEPGEKVGARALIYLRRRDGVGAGDFRKFVNKELVPALAGTGALRELRTQIFLPWNEKTLGHPERRARQPGRPAVPRVADPRASPTPQARAAFFDGREIESLSNTLAPLASAIHAYDVDRGADLRQGRHDPPALSAVAKQEETCGWWWCSVGRFGRSAGGRRRIRTSVGYAGDFTGRSLWPLGHPPVVHLRG